jgi:GT2 family glycosyltransferase
MGHITTNPYSPNPLHVVILNLNLPEETILCVDSVRGSLPPDAEIIIVDNGSTDHSVKLIRKRFGDTIRIIENSENLGFTAGTNVGIRRALAEGAQCVLLLNNDTVVDANMIHHLVSAANERPRAGILSPVIYYYDQPERIWHLGDREYSWLPVPVRLTERDLAKARQQPFRVDYANACGVLIRRQVFETIGLLDPGYCIYFEDADFCRRTRDAGYEIWCVPRALMWHKVSLTMRKQKPATRYAQWWGRARFFRRHPHGFSQGLTLAYVLVKAVWTTIGDLLSGDWELLKPLWMGVLEGHCNRPSRFFEFLK